MGLPPQTLLTEKPVHTWLRDLNVAFAPGPMNPLLEELSSNLLERFRLLGHETPGTPDNSTDLIFTTAPYGEPLSWRKAMLFTARRRFKLNELPTIYTLMSITPTEFDQAIAHFEAALAKSPPDPDDFLFPGLSPVSHRVLVEQGLRGGPILSLMRLIQAQAKCLRVLLTVGDDHPERLYHFDLVGAYPISYADTPQAFYEDIVLRIVTTESTVEVTDHEIIDPPIPLDEWRTLSTPAAMGTAGRELGKRDFFTDMIRIQDLVHVPAVGDAVADQYSEGCFATWEPELDALIATVTGSARPVDKENITEDELAALVGIRPDGMGAKVRHVTGKRNDPPSSEAVEMLDMDFALPKVPLPPEWALNKRVPVIRSKLHSHRGVRAYDPALVEYVPLDPPFYHYLVSCATQAQAIGIKAAFARAECFLNPDDPRQAAFTVLPGHGVVVAEKWVPGKQPFQLLWEFMDTGALQIDKHVPQGPMRFDPSPEDNRLHLIEA
ncbi:MAG: hypothetical protein OEV06_03820 [Anaerolineae bacterium]|nr:hypothetical protein [Anaerolineae bacterium]